MTVLGKLGSIIIHAIIPKKFREGFDYKVKKTYDAFHSTLELKIFWRVLFFPIKLPLSLLAALFKTLLAWVLSKKRYGELGYLINELYNDIVLRKTGISLAFKRSSLLNEMFVKGAEKRVSYGEKNPDKTFYVIRPYYYLTRNELATSLSDLLFHYYRNLQQLSYAINKGWIPVVDWENYLPLRHMEDYPVNGTVNGWEYFWEQPSEYTLSEVYQSKNVVLANRNSVNYGFIPTPFIITPLQKYAEDLARRCPKYDKYFKLNSVTKQHIEEQQKALFPEGKRILGVSIRGASYGNHPLPRHPKQPTMDELIVKVKKEMKEYDMDYVFFACEAERCINIMKESFGERLIVLERERLKEEPKVGEGETNPLYYPGKRFKTNLDYLTEMALLSKCNRLMAGMSSGTRAAIIWNANQYENIHIFDEGLW